MALILAARRAAVASLMNIPARGFREIDESYTIENYKNVVFPPGTERKLPAVPKIPIFYEGELPQKTGRRLIEMRGPELIHTELIHKQYALQCIDGSEMRWAHFEHIRKDINHHIDLAGEENMFAIWRVPFPWLARTPRSRGKKRGGGKGKIAFYVTPVKHGRIICEIGGYISESTAYRILCKPVFSLPFKCRFVSQKILMEEKEQEERIKKENLNKFTWDFCLKWNMQNISDHINPYDPVWGGKHK